MTSFPFSKRDVFPLTNRSDVNGSDVKYVFPRCRELGGRGRLTLHLFAFAAVGTHTVHGVSVSTVVRVRNAQRQGTTRDGLAARASIHAALGAPQLDGPLLRLAVPVAVFAVVSARLSWEYPLVLLAVSDRAR